MESLDARKGLLAIPPPTAIRIAVDPPNGFARWLREFSQRLAVIARRIVQVEALQVLLLAVATAILSSSAYCQKTPDPDKYLPPELQAHDPEIKDLLNSARSDSDTGNYDAALSEAKSALTLAEKKGLVNDKALAEEVVATGYFFFGHLADSVAMDKDCLQDAIDSTNDVLQADVLVALSVSPQFQGNTVGAIDILNQALDRANHSKSLFIKARVLGELGKEQLLSGHVDDGRRSITEALDIDKSNGYMYEALHTVYLCYAMLAEPAPDLPTAIASLEAARDLALQKNHYVTLVLAESALARVLILKGDVVTGIHTLEAAREGTILKDGKPLEMPTAFRIATSQPYLKATLLEGLAGAYEQAKEPDKALHVWTELYSYSDSSGINVTAGEAALKSATIYTERKDTANALRFYALAIDMSRKTQNDTQLSQALVGNALCLIQTGDREKAIPLEIEIQELSARIHNRQLQFAAEVGLAQLYLSEHKQAEEKQALESAQALVTPGPMDSDIDNNVVIGVYAGLAGIYESVDDPLHAMIALEKGFAVASSMKIKDKGDTFAQVLSHEVESFHLEEQIEKTYQGGDLEDALLYSEILFVYKGSPPAGHDEQYWNFVLSLPFQIVSKTDGPAVLASDLNTLGPMLGMGRLAIVDALSHHYLFVENKPQLGRQYALQSESVLGTNWPVNALKVRSTCTLAIAYSQTRDLALARDTLGKCLDYANQVPDKDSKNMAQVTNVMVNAAMGDIDKAGESLLYLRTANPDNPAIHEQLAAILSAQGQYDRAMPEYELALHTYETKGNKSAVANTYRSMGIALKGSKSSADQSSALKYLNKAMDTYKRMGNFGGQASIQLALGEYYAGQNDLAASENHLQLTVKLAQDSGRSDLEANALSDLANNCATRKAFAEAVVLQKQAVEAYKRSGNADGEAFTLLALGFNYEKQYNMQDSLASYLEAKALASKSTSENVQSSVQERLGWYYYNQGRYEEAETAFEEAVRINEAAGDESGLGRVYLDLSSVFGTIGDWNAAVESAGQCLELSKRNKNAQMEYQADVELMAIYSDRTSTVQDFEKALKYYSDALALKIESDNSVPQLDLLEIYLQTREYDKAAVSAQQGIEACKRLKDDACLGNGLISLAEVNRLEDHLVTAEQALAQAAPLVANGGDYYLKGRLLYGQAGLARSKGQLEDAAAKYGQLIGLIEAAKGVDAQNTQGNIAENYDFVYGELIDVLFSMSERATGADQVREAEIALRYSESNKARQFVKQWGRGIVAGLRSALPAKSQDEESALVGKRDQLRAELQHSISDSLAISGRSPALIQSDIDAADRELTSFVSSLRGTAPVYTALAYPEPVSIENLFLHAGELVIEFKVTENATFVWMIEAVPDGGSRLTAFYRIPQGRQWIAQRVESIRTAFNQAQPDSYQAKNSEELFDALFPLSHANDIGNHSSLTIIPDDALFLIAFEMLSPNATRGSFELMGKSIRYYPSLSALRIGRGAHEQGEWPEAFLGVGDPVTSPNDPRYVLATTTAPLQQTAPAKDAAGPVSVDSDRIATIRSRGFSFERIPETAHEVKDVAGLFQAEGQNAKVMLGLDATKVQLESMDLAQFKFLHFATHGVLPVDGGISEPSLVFSFDGTTPQNMLFSVSDILKMAISADTVVLSACNTGSGKVSHAEGVMSLGRAFMAAGAHSVTVSLWAVSDDSTQMFMEEYYKNLINGKDKPEALALSRSYVFAKGFKSPFFWAPFVLIGE